MNERLELIFDDLREQVESMSPINAKMKFVMDEYIYTIDGTGNKNVVGTSDIEANCTVKTDLDTFFEMKEGKINPVAALMKGRVDIDGSMGLAFKMKGLLS